MATRLEISLQMRQGEVAVKPTITDGMNSVGIGCPLSEVPPAGSLLAISKSVLRMTISSSMDKDHSRVGCARAAS